MQLITFVFCQTVYHFIFLNFTMFIIDTASFGLNSFIICMLNKNSNIIIVK